MAAPLERPDHGTVLRSFAGTVHVSPDVAYEKLAVALAPTSAEDGSFSVDPVQRLLVQQGGWWYRAEYRVAQTQGGEVARHQH